MPKRKLPKRGTEAYAECIRIVKEASRKEVEKKAEGLGFATGSSFLTTMLKEGHHRPAQDAAPKYVQPPRTIERDLELEKAQSNARYYKSAYNEALKRVALGDVVAEAMREAAAMVPALTVKSARRNLRPVIEDRGSETDVLQLSDFHSGEVVNPEETMGISQFDMGILSRRLGMLFRKTLELVEIRRSALYIPKLIVAQLGDMLSGDIHAELVRTNVAPPMTIAVRTAFMVSQGLAFLSPHFDTIEVDCVIGNHPRLYLKPTYKEAYLNWDYLCYQWQAAFCRDISNIKFNIPKSPFMLTNAENTRLLLSHGDTIKSWMGIPWYGIQRAAHRFRELLQAAGDYYDAIMLGHFHSRADMATATGPIIVNGSVKGGDEFSMGSLQSANKPSQNLLHFHNEHGYIGGNPIYLAGADEREDLALQDFLPDVWSDLVEAVGNVEG